MLSLKKIFFSLIFILLFSILFGCAVTRKLDAANIISNTKIEFKDLILDSAEINPDIFKKLNENSIKSSLLPNPQVVKLAQDIARGIIEQELGKANIRVSFIADNSTNDTLWINSLNATLELDSIINLPLSLNDSSVLTPGKSELILKTKFPLDKRLFLLRNVSKYCIKGSLVVALESNGESVELNFNQEKIISPEEKISLEDRAREALLNGLINNWVGSIL